MMKRVARVKWVCLYIMLGFVMVSITLLPLSSSVKVTVVQAANETDLPSPSWWDGDCDTNNYYSHTGYAAYALGGSYRGVKACGPMPMDYPYPSVRNPGPTVYFFAGAWGEYEWQCVELVMRYMYLAYGIRPYSANGSTVVANYSQARDGGNLIKIYNPGTAGVIPKPGDIVSYGATTTVGHTALIIASQVDVNGNGTFTTLNQNIGGVPNGIRVQAIRNWKADDITGWLHNPANEPYGFIDGPPHNSTQVAWVRIGGWAEAAGSPIVQVKVFIDGVARGDAAISQPRNDGKPGWYWDWDTTGYDNGNHTVQIQAIAANGSASYIQSTAGASFTINVQNPFGCVDGPPDQSTQSGTVRIGGWAKVDQSTIDHVEIWIDDQYRGNATYGTARPDIGGNFGWYWDWNTTGETNGQHTYQGRAAAANSGYKVLCGGSSGIFHITVQNNTPTATATATATTTATATAAATEPTMTATNTPTVTPSATAPVVSAPDKQPVLLPLVMQGAAR